MPISCYKTQNIWLWTKWVSPPPTVILNIPRAITPTSNNLNYYTPQRVPQSNFSKTVKIAVKRHHTSTHFGDISTHSNLKQLNLTWHTGWTKIWTTFFGHSPKQHAQNLDYASGIIKFTKHNGLRACTIWKIYERIHGIATALPNIYSIPYLKAPKAK